MNVNGNLEKKRSLPAKGDRSQLKAITGLLSNSKKLNSQLNLVKYLPFAHFRRTEKLIGWSSERTVNQVTLGIPDQRKEMPVIAVTAQSQGLRQATCQVFLARKIRSNGITINIPCRINLIKMGGKIATNPPEKNNSPRMASAGMQNLRVAECRMDLP